ncbi:hypothetical protein ABXS71_20610 [Bacillus infantis]|uniref:hypothetical protein n=1 Tax=Bacillus infantis TaxID=324767 RepID=UPI00344F8A3D
MISPALESDQNREQFQLEVDWYVVNATNQLLSIIAKPLLELDKKNHLRLVEALTKRTLSIQQLLNYIQENTVCTLGKDVAQERFKSSDYPSNFLTYIQRAPIEKLYIEFKEKTDQTTEDLTDTSQTMTKAYLYVLKCANVLLNYIELNVKKAPAILQFKKKQLVKSLEEYTSDLINAINYFTPRVYQLIEWNFKDVLSLFEYKSLYLYLDKISSVNINQLRFSDEALKDTIETLQHDLESKLLKVMEKDLWYLGNHVFEEIGQSFGLNMEFLRSNGHYTPQEAKTYRNALTEFIELLSQEKKVELLAELILNEDFSDTIRERILEFKEIFQLLDKSLLEVIERYENFDMENLDSDFVLDEDKMFFSFLKNLGFHYDQRYDDLERNGALQMEYCTTLDVKVTDIPGKDMLISDVHKKGILHKDKCIRRNLVTVYQFEMKEEEGEF